MKIRNGKIRVSNYEFEKTLFGIRVMSLDYDEESLKYCQDITYQQIEEAKALLMPFFEKWHDFQDENKKDVLGVLMVPGNCFDWWISRFLEDSNQDEIKISAALFAVVFVLNETEITRLENNYRVNPEEVLR